MNACCKACFLTVIGFNKISHENISGKRAASEGAGLNVSGPAKIRGAGDLQAAKDINDSVRGAPHDSMRHATYGLVEQQTGARRTGQSLVVEGVVFITSGVRSDGADRFIGVWQVGDERARQACAVFSATLRLHQVHAASHNQPGVRLSKIGAQARGVKTRPHKGGYMVEACGAGISSRQHVKRREEFRQQLRVAQLAVVVKPKADHRRGAGAARHPVDELGVPCGHGRVHGFVADDDDTRPLAKPERFAAARQVLQHRIASPDQHPVCMGTKQRSARGTCGVGCGGR